ncbi:PTS lactose/cellobiose transporter subunit IIA [Streptococcus minor]|nr:PTS lactose/cellobiose transporter subunit IIA [Streptococcus minor]
MAEEQTVEVAMQLIMYGGEAKSNAMEAIQAAKKQLFEVADVKLQAAHAALLVAHHSQTELLSKEAQGEKNELNLFLIHGQDHLMTSIAFVDLTKEIIDLYKQLN